jgi:hypothetical protein
LEQVDADNELERAIQKAARAYGHLEHGWALGDFVVCMEHQPFTEDQVGRVRYSYILPGDRLPLHRVKGLLMQTLDNVDNYDEE